MAADPSCRIKLCGLRTADDVHLAVSLGVDAVGFVLTRSPRQVEAETCRSLRNLIPETITVHGVFAGNAPEEIRHLVGACRLDVAQIHGAEEDDGFWSKLEGIPTIRAFRVSGPDTLARLESVRGQTFLLDAFVSGVPGGTGETFDWNLALQARAYGKVILAGGLDAENVQAAISAARPWMVDVSGGIETEKGVKDPRKMRAFVKAVRRH